MATSSDALEQAFPALRDSGYAVTSPPTDEYNCVAWAAGRNDVWMWPDLMGVGFWPAEVRREESLEAFVEAFGAFGYSRCESDALESGVEKVAVFAAQIRPTHVAVQLGDGRWSSKCGRYEDIAHSLRALEGPIYGEVTVILSRTQAPSDLHA
jgi:hypothetical protein